ncbi:MAG: hypothetical protein QXY18_00740 [Nitrososphaerota archaeon]
MKYLADTTFLIDLVNGNNKAIELAKEFDEINEFVGLDEIYNHTHQIKWLDKFCLIIVILNFEIVNKSLNPTY